MGHHQIHIEAVGTHTNPKRYPERKLADRVQEVGSAEHVAHSAVQALRESGHTVHRAHIVHHPSSPDEHVESLLGLDDD